VPARFVVYSVALPVQALLTLQILPYHPAICATSKLTSATAQQHTHRAFQLLNSLRFNPLEPAPTLLTEVAGHAPPSTTEECATLMSYFQLSIGLVGPALAQAMIEARLFAVHQQQRQRAQLAREQGWHAGLYAVVLRLLGTMDSLTTAAFLWALHGLLFDLARVLTASPLTFQGFLLVPPSAELPPQR